MLTYFKKKKTPSKPKFYCFFSRASYLESDQATHWELTGGAGRADRKSDPSLFDLLPLLL